jgi:aerobic carbon-monoxide dehydrogenase small subunit
MMKALTFTLNGDQTRVEVDPGELLLDVLRRRLFLTGTKKGCGEGECGACTVLLDGQPVLACLLPAMKVQGRAVTTIEGLGHEQRLHPVQEAFLEKGAVQCGFCTPGMVLSSKSLLDGQPQPSEDEIKQALSGHLCRCTGYVQILEAVKDAAEKMTRAEGRKGHA